MLVASSINSKQLTKKCCFDYIRDKNYPFVENFKNFSELNFKKCNNHELSGFSLKPAGKLILDNSLDFNNITLRSNSLPLTVILENIKGFDLSSNPFQNIIFNVSNVYNPSFFIYYILRDSNFDFYYKNKKYEICDESLFKFNKNIFTYLYGLDASFSDISYNQEICPLIFYKSSINFLTFSSTNSLFIKNILSFTNLSKELAMNIDSDIGALDLKLYHVELNEKLLNKHVFKKLIYLTINGIIELIKDDLFKSFNNLKMIRLKVENIKKLFQKQNKWLKYLNNQENVDNLKIKYNLRRIFALIIEQTRYNHTLYNFPNEDFCYFKDFPHHKLVMPFLKPFESKYPTCTQLFLIQYSNKYTIELVHQLKYFPKDGYIDTYYYGNFDTYTYFKGRIDIKCNDFFLRKKISCIIEKLDMNSDFHFYVFDWNILVKYNQIIFSMILNPLFGLICIGLNILTIMILSNKHMNDKQEIYSNLKMNSYFLVGFNFISLFKLLYVCMNKSNWNDAKLFIDFCLHGLELGIGRYLNIIFIKFLNNSFKTCSNFYYTLFTLDRYVQTTDSKNLSLKKISSISFKIKLLIIIFASLLINLYSYFQYSKSMNKNIQYLHKRTVFSPNIDKINKSLLADYNNFNDYSQELSSSSLLILQVFSIIKILFSDLFFSLLSLLFDFYLLTFVIKKLKKKKELLESSNTLENKSKKKKIKNIESTKTKVISMIILNGLNFLIFRTSSLVFSFYGFIYRYDFRTDQNLPSLFAYYICRTQHFCNLLSDIAFFFYLISIIVQFFIFFKLDNNFRISFKNIFKLNHNSQTIQ
jgi:hypothetical protein